MLRRSRALRRSVRVSRRRLRRTSRGIGSTPCTRQCCRAAPSAPARPFVTRTPRATAGWRLPMHGGFDTVPGPSTCRLSRGSRDPSRSPRGHSPHPRPSRRRSPWRSFPSAATGSAGPPLDRLDCSPSLGHRCNRRDQIEIGNRSRANPRYTRPASPTRISFAPWTSSSPSQATASSRTAWPTARRCSIPRVAASPEYEVLVTRDAALPALPVHRRARTC